MIKYLRDSKTTNGHFGRQNPENKASGALSIRLCLLTRKIPVDALKSPVPAILAPRRRTEEVKIHYAGTSMRALCLN